MACVMESAFPLISSPTSRDSTETAAIGSLTSRDDFVLREPQVHGLREEPVETLEQPPPPRIPGQLVLRLGDEHPAPGTIGEQALALELGVGPGDRVGIDHQIARKLAHRGQLLVRLQVAAGDRLAHLLHQLLVDRQPARTVDFILHGTTLINCTNCLNTVSRRCQYPGAPWISARNRC